MVELLLRGGRPCSGEQDGVLRVQLVVLVHLTLQDARGEEINPVFWSDNFITLFPGDEKVITARVAVSDAGGVAPTFVLSR